MVIGKIGLRLGPDPLRVEIRRMDDYNDSVMGTGIQT